MSGVGGEPLRVAHVITRLELGGAQQNTLYTVRHLDPARFRPHLLCGPGGMLDDEAKRSGVPVTFVGSLVRPVRPVHDAAALAQLVAAWRRLRPHVVHTHSSKAGVLGRLAAHLAGVPVVLHTIHGFGFGAGGSRAARALLVTAERAVAPLTSHFIVVSEANRREGIRRGLFPPERVTLIRSGVDLRRFRAAAPDRAGLRREIGAPAAAPLVGMVACLKPQKAPVDYVAAAGRLARRVPDAHYVLVGDGELRGRVEDAVRREGLTGRFHLLGWRRDVDRILASLDVLVHTARWEGLPRVFLEALAVGVPVVTTDVDGAADVIRDDRNGYRVPPGDLEGIALHAGRILRDPDLRRRLGSAGLEGADEFEIDTMVARQQDLYLELMDRARGQDRTEGHLAGSRA